MTGRFVLTIRMLDAESTYGEVIATGIAPNSREGLFMTREGGEVRWVLKKGIRGDWEVFWWWSNKSVECVTKLGNKVRDRGNISNIIRFSDAVWKRYRF